MSLTEEKRNRIKNHIMEKIFKNQPDFINRTAETFKISVPTTYKYLNMLIDENKVEKIENGNYALVKTVNKIYKYSLVESKLEEDIIYEKTLKPYVENLSENARKIWEYSFTEMFNNVIDHSQADEVTVIINQNALYTWVNIRDNGVGIFEKIAKYYNYSTLDDALLSLFKGKLTTDADNHSGEGIFFTSRVMDHFGAISSNKYFSQDNTLETIKDLEEDEMISRKANLGNGTLIIMALANQTNRTLKEVFDMYADVDGGFTVTKIPMKHVCDSGYPVSRSQAKRLYFGFDKFEKVILDFADVEDMGQGFAHELFNVFQKKYPNIEITCINTNENIEKMINRVKN